MRTILLFIDGLGWGRPNAATNPQHAYGGEIFRLPELPKADANPVWVDAAHGGVCRAVDAVLGVDGLPQSATGQTTLLSGCNAQAHLGKHLTGFPNEKLRALLLKYSVLKSLADQGRKACFINAFRPRFFEMPRERQLLFSATTVANLAADLPFFSLDDIEAQRSIYQEFTNRELQEKGFEVSTMTPRQAGQILARQSRHYDFILYEYFQTDKAGHSGLIERSSAELAKLDEFVETLLTDLAAYPDDETLVLLTSDHGNLEDATTRRHTSNPVPLYGWGVGAEAFIAPIHRLDQVTPAIVRRHR